MEAATNYTNVESLKKQYEQLTKEGHFAKALDVIEQVVEVLSKNKENPEQLDDAMSKLAQSLNAVGMIHLESSDYEACYKLLKRAEGLSIKNCGIRSTTLNNLGCYYRKTNKLSTALMYLQKSLEMQTRAKITKNMSDTYLNICAVLSSLSMHNDALHNAMMSVIMLQHDLIMTVSDQLEDRIDNIVKPDRLSVLGLGYYNMAVEFEHLKEVLYTIIQVYQARDFYGKAVDITQNLNCSNGKLLNNLQTAKKKFEMSLKRVKHIDQALSHGNLKKMRTGFQPRIEHIRTETDMDTFYKSLEDNIKKSHSKINEQQMQKKPLEHTSYRNIHRHSHDQTSKQQQHNYIPMKIRKRKLGCLLRFPPDKPRQAKTIRIQSHSPQLH